MGCGTSVEEWSSSDDDSKGSEAANEADLRVPTPLGWDGLRHWDEPPDHPPPKAAPATDLQIRLANM